MATVVTKTVGPAGRDYTSLSAAITGEVAARPNLVSNDEQLIIECDAATYAEGGQVFVNGFSTDATRSIIIRAASGAEHGGVFGAGVVFDCTDLRVSDPFVTLDNLEFVFSSGSAARADNDDITFNALILDASSSTGTNEAINMFGNRFICRNSVILCGARGPDLRNFTTPTIENCTVIGLNGGLGILTNSATVVRNCAVTGFSTDIFGTPGTSTTNATGVSLTDGVDFVAPSTDNYTPVTTGALYKAGINPASGFATDITGETRAYWDIGAFASETFESQIKQTITVDPDKVPSDQGSDLSSAGIPLFYDLSRAQSAFWNTVSNGGGDIRVFEADGVTELPREVVSCDTSTETGELHFLADHVDSVSPTRFLIMADGVSSDYASDHALGSENVWQDYEVVWHGGNATKNSTGKGDGVSTGTSFISGQMGSAMEFTRDSQDSTERVDFTLTETSPTAYALQMWFQHYSSAAANYALSIADKDATNNQIRVGHDEGATHQYGTFMFSPTVNAIASNLDAETNDDTWVHIVSRASDTSAFDTVLNGDAAATGHADAGSWSGRTNLDRMTIGVSADSTPIRPLDGAVGEARLRWSTLSDDWITTEYNNQSDNASFFLQGTDSADLTKVTDLTINSSEIDGDLTDYVVYLDGADLNSDLWSTANDDGSDIRIYKSGGVIELPREIVSFDGTAETAEIHFKYEGTLSSTVDTDLEIYAGDAALADYAATAPYGRNEVWSDYALVMHMNSLADSSGTLSGAFLVGGAQFTSSASSDPLLTDALLLDGGNDYINVPNNAALDFAGDFTMQAIWKTDNATKTQRIQRYDGSSKDGYALRILADGVIDFAYWVNPTATLSKTAAGYASTTDAAYLYGVRGSDQPTLYANGVAQTSGSALSGAIDSSEDLHIGSNFNGGGDYFDGIIGEFRLRADALSADWISTEYNNQSSPSTFYTASNPGAGAGDDYTLSLAAGSFALTGGSVDLLTGRLLSLSAGSFSLTGGDLGLAAGKSLELEGGTFDLTGGSLETTVARLLSLSAGTFSTSGGVVDLVYSPILGPTYTLSLDSGSLALSGGSVDVLANKAMELQGGTFSATGGSLELLKASVIDLDSGTFLLTGGSLLTGFERVITLEEGDYTVTGGLVTLTYSGGAKVVSILGVPISGIA